MAKVIRENVLVFWDDNETKKQMIEGHDKVSIMLEHSKNRDDPEENDDTERKINALIKLGGKYKFSLIVEEIEETSEETMMLIEYKCPKCDYDWEEVCSCACNNQCPHCGQKDVQELSSSPV